MIKKYVYGTPFPTDAVVLDVQPSTDALPFFETDQQGTFTYSLSENDIVYVWANRFVASTREAGSMSAGTTITPTTTRILVPSMVHTTSSSFMVQ